MSEVIRRCRFRPYLKGRGPTFSLTLWDTFKKDPRSQWRTLLGYRLKQGRKVLFEGEDFGASPLHADDSDLTVAALMEFLTLRPGDTDAEYFEGYSPAQVEFCEQHAEALGAECMYRFDKDLQRRGSD